MAIYKLEKFGIMLNVASDRNTTLDSSVFMAIFTAPGEDCVFLCPLSQTGQKQGTLAVITSEEKHTET